MFGFLCESFGFMVEIHVGRTERIPNQNCPLGGFEVFLVSASHEHIKCRTPESHGGPHVPSPYWWIFTYSFTSLSFLQSPKAHPNAPESHTFILFLWLCMQLWIYFFKSNKRFYMKLSLALKRDLPLSAFQKNSYRALNQQRFIQNTFKLENCAMLSRSGGNASPTKSSPSYIFHLFSPESQLLHVLCTASLVDMAGEAGSGQRWGFCWKRFKDSLGSRSLLSTEGLMGSSFKETSSSLPRQKLQK